MQKIGWLLLATLAAPEILAGEYTATATAPPGGVTTLDVSFAGDGRTVETEVSLTFNNAFVSISNPVEANNSICLLVNPTRLRIIPPSGGNTPLPAATTTYCRFRVTVAGTAPQGLIALAPADVLCFNADANAEPCSLASGAGITVAGEPVPPPPPVPLNLSYQPLAGTLIAFVDGQAPNTPAPPRTVAVTANGGLGEGSASLSACTLTGSGADRFSVLPNGLDFSTAGTQSVSIGCNYPSADALATLTCTEIDADSPAPGVPRAFNLRCPAAPPTFPRRLSYQPQVGTLITFAEGQVPNTPAPPRPIDVHAVGSSGTASVSDCTLSGSGADRFSVSPTSLDFPSPNAQSLSIGCNYLSADALATLTCTEIDGDTPAPGAPRAFNLRCPAAPPPTRNPVISSTPASGATISASAALLGLMGLTTINLIASDATADGSATISCSSSGEVQLAAVPATPSGQGPINQTVLGNAQPTSIRVGVILTDSAQSPAGTITCAVSGQNSLSFTVTAPRFGSIGPIISPPPPSPGLPRAPLPIPTLSLVWLLALAGLLGLWGLLTRLPKL